MRKKTIIIFIITFINILLVSLTYSFFLAKGSINIDQKIAKFVFDAKQTDLISLPITSLNPGDSSIYNFQVTNTKTNIISDVNIDYQFVIKTYHFIPLDIKLYKSEITEENLILNCTENFGRNGNNEVVCNSPVQKINFENTNLEDFQLQVTFPEEYNTEDFSELVDYIELEIKSWQSIGG